MTSGTNTNRIVIFHKSLSDDDDLGTSATVSASLNFRPADMLYKLHTHGGFTTAVSAPPNAITPEQVIRHHRDKRRGGMGGQALSPP